MGDTLSGPPSSRRWHAFQGVGRSRPSGDSTAAHQALRQGDAHLRAGQFTAAIGVFRSVLKAHDRSHVSVTVEAFLRLGHAHWALDHKTTCKHYFAKALELDPGHVPTLRSLIELHIDDAEFEEAESVEERLFAAVGDDHERVDELMRSGDRWSKVEEELLACAADESGRYEVQTESKDRWWMRAESAERAERRYQQAYAGGSSHPPVSAHAVYESGCTAPGRYAVGATSSGPDSSEIPTLPDTERQVG